MAAFEGFLVRMPDVSDNHSRFEILGLSLLS